jgi:Virus neck protein
MTTSSYFQNGTKSEQNLVQDLIIESIKLYGQNVCYIPRTLVSLDQILGEDRLSEFNHSYRIEMYFDQIDNFEGQGSFISKFGLMIEQSATLVVARRRWEQLIGRTGNSILPNRPCEGDLIYFPLTGGLFEIKFVQYQDPFYQLGKLYVYKIQIELFQYGSEIIQTGDPEIDAFESLKSFDVEVNPTGEDTLEYNNNTIFQAESPNILFDPKNPFGSV